MNKVDKTQNKHLNYISLGLYSPISDIIRSVFLRDFLTRISNNTESFYPIEKYNPTSFYK